jgi:hypothetical protein
LCGKFGFRWRLVLFRVEGVSLFLADPLDGQLQPSSFIMVDGQARSPDLERTGLPVSARMMELVGAAAGRFDDSERVNDFETPPTGN